MARTTTGDGAGWTIPHGGRIILARRRFPEAPEPFLDLSTGINPVPYPLPALPAAAFTRLPEPEALDDLQAVAAHAYDVVDPAMVVAAPGTQILIDLLPRLWPMRRVAVVGPTYAEHAAAWARGGAVMTSIKTLEEPGDCPAVIVCNPNNPDGRRFSPVDLLALADRLAARGGLLVVDEAFCDLEPAGSSMAPLLPHPSIVILRSFGKTFGLAGLRLGFALAAPDRAAKIRAAIGSWAVSGPALAIGVQALADRDWLRAARGRLERDVAQLDDCLHKAGLRVIGGTHLYRLASSPVGQAVFGKLGRAGILVRTFEDRPDWLRFGLPGDEAEWTRLRAAMERGSG